MPYWNQIVSEINSLVNPTKGIDLLRAVDIVRKKYLKEYNNYTGRNLIVYTSSWLHKQFTDANRIQITDEDVQGFMTTVHQLDCTKPLDIMLHSPGGSPEAAGQIMTYIRRKWNNVLVRAIIPQLAMSAATAISLGCNSILMGKQSALGPIDTQITFNGLSVSVFALVNEYEEIKNAITQDPALQVFYNPRLALYTPGLLPLCEGYKGLSTHYPTEWLKKYMFGGTSDADVKTKKAVDFLVDNKIHGSHGKHLTSDVLKANTDLILEDLDSDSKLQDLVLSIHHASCITLKSSTGSKIIENHLGNSYIS